MADVESESPVVESESPVVESESPVVESESPVVESEIREALIEVLTDNPFPNRDLLKFLKYRDPRCLPILRSEYNINGEPYPEIFIESIKSEIGASPQNDAECIDLLKKLKKILRDDEEDQAILDRSISFFDKSIRGQAFETGEFPASDLILLAQKQEDLNEVLFDLISIMMNGIELA